MNVDFIENWAPNPGFGKNPVRDTWVPVPDQTDPGFGFALVESTPTTWNHNFSSKSKYTICATPFRCPVLLTLFFKQSPGRSFFISPSSIAYRIFGDMNKQTH